MAAGLYSKRTRPSLVALAMLFPLTLGDQGKAQRGFDDGIPRNGFMISTPLS